MPPRMNTLRCGDCVAGMKKIDAETVDLAFADPPYNIGYDYDAYDDRRAAEEYLDWARDWTAEVVRLLKPDGTFWLAIGDDFAAEMKVMLQQEHDLHTRSWVIWYYTFGVNCKQKFSRSHTHLLYMVKDPANFTFNADDKEIRVPSARQLVYGDKRANPKGRLPDDTWILRPQDIPESFQGTEDTWYFPRVCGTFKERAGFHGCQMPEQMLGRIIRACSNEGDVVLDPLAGTGSTLVVAKKLGRKYLGYELSEEYVDHAKKRLKAARKGTPLDGAAEPLKSVPNTANGKKLEDRGKKKQTPKQSSKDSKAKKAPAKEEAPEPVAAKSTPKKAAKDKAPEAETTETKAPKATTKSKTQKPRAQKKPKKAEKKPSPGDAKTRRADTAHEEVTASSQQRLFPQFES